MEEKKPNELAAKPFSTIERAIEADVPKIYFNGFENALGTGDIGIALVQNGKPVALISASYTVAKTLALKLGELIQVLEKRTGNNIMTTHDIEVALRKNVVSEQRLN